MQVLIRQCMEQGRLKVLGLHMLAPTPLSILLPALASTVYFLRHLFLGNVELIGQNARSESIFHPLNLS
jgi:hypothetical protein